MALSDNLVSYFKFDNNVTDEVGSNSLTTTSGTSYVTGLLGDAIRFTTTGYSNKTSASGFNTGTGPISFSFWIKATSWAASGAGYWVMVVGNGSNTNDYVLAVSSGTSTSQMRVIIGNGSSTSTSGDVNCSLSGSAWTHVVVTRDGTAWQVYRNGSALSSGTYSTNRTATASNRLQVRGGLNNGDPPNVQQDIDEVGIWNRVITADEVAELYNGGAGLAYPFASGGDAQNALFFGGGL
jgi:hypothetical protein